MTSGELGRIYDAHGAALFAFLLNFTRDEADTRDVLQEVFRRLAGRDGGLEGVADERGFLLRMAHNQAVDLIRRRDARDRAHSALAGEPLALFAATDDPDDAELRSRLSGALGELPSEQRVVVQLKLWEGLTFEAIARLLDIPPNTAASRYRYGVDKLRARLRPLYEEIR